MDIVDDDKSPAVPVTDFSILTDDQLESERFDDDCKENISETPRSIICEMSTESSILGRHFKLPDLSKSFDPDPPTLDSSLPYIPVYTHLITHDLAAIERPKTPPLLKMLRSGKPMQSKNHLKSSPMINPRTTKMDDQGDEQAINYSGGCKNVKQLAAGSGRNIESNSFTGVY